MDVKEMVIEVNGLPDDYPDDNKMTDNLTMHFLRPSNNGGEVLIVIYPTSSKGQAYVVFESEVPRVLDHHHVLELDSQFYPLDVKKIHQPKFDMPAEALLDVSMFSSQKRIQNLLHSHGFDVSETRSGQLHLQGTFLNLKRVNPKLMRLLAQDTQPQRTTPSGYTNGYPSDYESRSHFTSRHGHNNGHSRYAAAARPSSGVNSRSPESPNRLMQAASPLDVSSSTESSFSSPSRSYEDSSVSVRQQNPSSPRKTEASFHVDLDMFNYVMHFKESFIEKIKSDYHTKVNHEDSLGFVHVKLTGGAFEEAAKKLSKFMQEMSSSLYTHEIDMNKIDHNQRKYITEKAYSYQDIYTVLIRQEGSIIKVVGLSKDSYEAKEKLLGREVDNTLPRDFQKNRLRRSRSLPKQKTRTREDADLGRRPDAIYATTVTSSSASRSRDSQPDVQQERGRKSSKSSAQRDRAKSTSRLEHKNQTRGNQEPPATDEHDLTPTKEVQMSKRNPNMKSPLVNIDKLMKTKWHLPKSLNKIRK
ncbi:RNA-binding protein 43 [Puntigrus tetrazona]|uniref:RNA-binding protein 43 n=1 Tax=Puntigrus tetrazona TaxID=1606681 RepID=UPI001C88EC32|nr:RNA-binding protein 43 [Puntigrus tetrazona]